VPNTRSREILDSAANAAQFLIMAVYLVRVSHVFESCDPSLLFFQSIGENWVINVKPNLGKTSVNTLGMSPFEP